MRNNFSLKETLYVHQKPTLALIHGQGIYDQLSHFLFCNKFTIHGSLFLQLLLDQRTCERQTFLHEKWKSTCFPGIFLNAANYPTPWTMWGLPVRQQDVHIGNVKLGPAGTRCHELSSVS